MDFFKNFEMPKPTQDQLDGLRMLFEGMVDLEPLLPEIRERARIEAIIDRAFEQRDF